MKTIRAIMATAQNIKKRMYIKKYKKYGGYRFFKRNERVNRISFKG